MVVPAVAAEEGEGDHKHTRAVDTSFPGMVFGGPDDPGCDGCDRRLVPLQVYRE